MYTQDNIYTEITEQGYTWCAVYQGKLKKLLITDRGGFKNTAESCKEKLKKYFDKNPGEYQVQLKMRPNDRDSNSIWFTNVSVNTFGTNGTEFKNQLHVPVDAKKLESDLRKKIQEEIKEAERKKSIVEKEKQLDDELASLRTFAGRFNAFINILMTPKQMTGNLQGTNTNTMNNNLSSYNLPLHNDAVDPKTLTQEQANNVDNALILALHSMGPDTFIKFALKVKNNPEVVNTLKSFI